MPVKRDEAIYAYRLILGREPESETVIQQAMEARDLTHLREVFLGSQEFAGKYGDRSADHLPVGRFLDVTKVEIDLDSTQEQLQAMFDRIGEAWTAFGDSEPHWSVLVSDDFRQENLAANIDRFYNSGHADIAVHLNFLRRAGLPVSFDTALDFGCGVGRLTLAMAPYARQVTGIDISRPHLHLAVERAREQAITNVGFDAIASVADLDRYRRFDLVISRIVLQHNPPPIMAALYAKLLGALAPMGVAIVQMPTFIHGQSFSTADYLANEQPQMEMNGLPQPAIYQIIEQAGCRLIEVREDGAGGSSALSHTFVVQKL